MYSLYENLKKRTPEQLKKFLNVNMEEYPYIYERSVHISPEVQYIKGK